MEDTRKPTISTMCLFRNGARAVVHTLCLTDFRHVYPAKTTLRVLRARRRDVVGAARPHPRDDICDRAAAKESAELSATPHDRRPWPDA